MIKKVLPYFFLISIMFAFPVSIFGTTVIQGSAPEYAGLKLEIFSYANPVSFPEKSLASCIIKPDGNFSVSFEADHTKMIFAHMGVYMLYMFAEPDAKYTVILPARQDKKPEDKLNPYFEEKQIHLIVKECLLSGKLVPLQEELNFYIRAFDDYYGPYMAKYALNVATQKEKTDRDTTIARISSMFPDNNLGFYNNYKNYKIGFLQFMSLQNRSKAISSAYFSQKPVLYDNPAYVELFNEVYDKYFLYFGRTLHGKAIYDDINTAKSYAKLWNTLSQDNVLQNDSVKELVILKGLHDNFYAMEFSRAGLLAVLDSMIISTKIAIHKEIGLQIREKVTRLLTGYAPPAFKLYDQAGKLRSLDDFKGKYTYLMFCTTQNYACITEFEQIKKLYEKHQDKLNVVTILADDNFDESRKFIKGKQLPWVFLHYANMPEVLKDYDIRAFPTYYLIDREGKLAISPAPSPSENFEVSFFNELRNKGIL